MSNQIKYALLVADSELLKKYVTTIKDNVSLINIYRVKYITFPVDKTEPVISCTCYFFATNYTDLVCKILEHIDKFYDAKHNKILSGFDPNTFYDRLLVDADGIKVPVEEQFYEIDQCGLSDRCVVGWKSGHIEIEPVLKNTEIFQYNEFSDKIYMDLSVSSSSSSSSFDSGSDVDLNSTGFDILNSRSDVSSSGISNSCMLNSSLNKSNKSNITRMST